MTEDDLLAFEREIEARREAFARRVRLRLMTQDKADREIATMRALLQGLRDWRKVPT